jgi:CelD/BcsL family acetyltransferase involved in cellulose biosynthesis
MAANPNLLTLVESQSRVAEARTEPEAGSYAISVASILPEFAGLAHEWEALNAASDATGIFNTWMWQFAWWDDHRAKRALKIVVARRRGIATGLVPLYLESARKSGLRVRALRLLGTSGEKNPYDIEPLIERDSAVATARSLAAALLEMKGHDVLQLADVAETNPLAAELPAAAQAAGWRCEVERSRRFVNLALPRSWNAYLEGLSSQQRARVRHRRHALAQAHPSRFVDWHAGRSVEAMLEALSALRARRGAGPAAVPSMLPRSALAEAARENRLRICSLEIGGRVAAVACAMRLRDRLVVIESDFDPQYAPWHPVSVLLQYTIERAIGEGVTGLHFLRGQQDFDDELFPEESRVRITAFRSAVAGAAFRADDASRAES